MKKKFNSVDEEIKFYKEETGRLKSELNRTEGELSSLMKQLEEEFGVKTVEEAKKKLKSVGEKIDQLAKVLTEEVEVVKRALEDEE